MQTINLNRLSKEICENIEYVLKNLGIESYNIYPDRISLPCPIHGGDNNEAVCIYCFNGALGNWKCWTKMCEEEILLDTKKGEKVYRERGQDIFGFIRGVLSVKYERHVEYYEAINWAISTLGHETKTTLLTDSIDYNLSILNRERTTTTGSVLREQIRERLQIPSAYFLDRGFSKEILDRYDVGLCVQYGKEMYKRVVCPFYDDDYKSMVGCIGRTLAPKCNVCNKYHTDDMGCPTNNLEKKWSQKWINNSGFSCHNFLYNYWFAKKHIQEKERAILVEGQPDVWRLEEAGCHIGLGLSGASLTDNQKYILDSSGIMKLIVLTDNDEAGLEAREKIAYKCKRYYNCEFIDLPKKDIGEMSIEEVQDLLGNLI